MFPHENVCVCPQCRAADPIECYAPDPNISKYLHFVKYACPSCTYIDDEEPEVLYSMSREDTRKFRGHTHMNKCYYRKSIVCIHCDEVLVDRREVEEDENAAKKKAISILINSQHWNTCEGLENILLAYKLKTDKDMSKDYLIQRKYIAMYDLLMSSMSGDQPNGRRPSGGRKPHTKRSFEALYDPKKMFSYISRDDAADDLDDVDTEEYEDEGSEYEPSERNPKSSDSNDGKSKRQRITVE